MLLWKHAEYIRAQSARRCLTVPESAQGEGELAKLDLRRLHRRFSEHGEPTCHGEYAMMHRFVTPAVPSSLWTVKISLRMDRGVLAPSIVLRELKRLRLGVDVTVQGSLGKKGGGMKQLTDRVGSGLQSLSLRVRVEAAVLPNLPSSILTLCMPFYSCETVAGLSVLTSLQALTLRSCDLTSLDGIEALPLRALNLACSQVRSIEPLSGGHRSPPTPQ